MSPERTWFALLSVVLLLQTAASSLDFHLGARFAVHLTASYYPGFAERTTVLEAAGERQPRFAAAVSLEAGTQGYYLCSLVVVLGDVTVWSSDRPVQEFAAGGLCQLELAENGQLRLTDGAGVARWWSGTAGLGAKVIHLLLFPSFSVVCLLDPLRYILPGFRSLRFVELTRSDNRMTRFVAHPYVRTVDSRGRWNSSTALSCISAFSATGTIWS
jgi:hypothetical protein